LDVQGMVPSLPTIAFGLPLMVPLLDPAEH
jgi:hypothetical protein